MPPLARSPTPAWRSPAFRRYWLGQAVSSVGDRLAPVALAFAVLEAGGSASELGLVLAAASAPYVLVLLAGGVWADRLAPRRVMLAADVVRLAAQAATGLLLVTDHASLGALVACQVVYGTAQAFFDPASTAMVPATVPPAALQDANALMGIQRNAALVLGPSLAGALVVAVGGGWGLLVDAATFAVSAAVLWRLPAGRDTARVPGARFRDELREGWRIFTGRTWLWGSVVHFSAFVGFVVGPLQVLGPLQARERLAGAAAWGLIAAGQGVGSLVGGLVALRVRPARPLAAGFLGLLVTWPLFLLVLAVAAPSPVIAVAAVPAGAAIAVFAALWVTALQRGVARDALSRVSAYDWLGTRLLQPVGLVLAGPLAAGAGAGGALAAIAGFCAVSTLAVLAVPAVRRMTAP